MVCIKCKPIYWTNSTWYFKGSHLWDRIESKWVRNLLEASIWFGKRYSSGHYRHRILPFKSWWWESVSVWGVGHYNVQAVPISWYTQHTWKSNGRKTIPPSIISFLFKCQRFAFLHLISIHFLNSNTELNPLEKFIEIPSEFPLSRLRLYFNGEQPIQVAWMTGNGVLLAMVTILRSCRNKLGFNWNNTRFKDRVFFR